VSQEHVKDLIPAYVLGCLDQDEAKAVQLHILDCLICQQEVKKFQLVVDQLPYAVRSCDPPDNLRENILLAADKASRQNHFNRSRHSWYHKIWGARIAIAWVGAATLIFFLIVTNLIQFQQIQQLEKSLDSAVSRAGNFQYVRLVGTPSTPQANGLLIISPNNLTATLIVDGLQPLPDRQDYQLWLIRDGKRDNGGVFNVIPTGYGVLLINSPKPINEYQAFGITVEPKGGSPGPTGDKVLGGNF